MANKQTDKQTGQKLNAPIQSMPGRKERCLSQINPFPNKPWFLPVCITSLLKTLWEKEKLLITSDFSFSHSVFYPFKELSAIFIKLEIVVCKLFQSFRKGLIAST